ncbi:hypothetical protein KJ586_01330 [Patescibacteria group bacterium]|nr:hypothetical protein [Patescibacteria group bacterium]
MTIKEICQIAAAVITSLGGGALLVLASSSWLGKIWADRILERERAKYQKDIEHYKNELDKLKIIALRYSSKQFELYNEFWEALCDMENVGDFLMTEASNENLKRFIEQFNITSLQIKKSFLFIEKSHFDQLQNLLNNFKKLQVGKEKLLEIREISGKKEVLKNILSNFIIQKNYKKLINEIGDNLKKQLKGME